jgi:hypothetical protein
MGWMQIDRGKLLGRWLEITFAIASEASFEDCLALLAHEFEYPLIVYKSQESQEKEYEVIERRKDFAKFLEKNEDLVRVLYRIYEDMSNRIVIEVGSEDLQDGMEGLVRKVVNEVESRLSSRVRSSG